MTDPTRVSSPAVEERDVEYAESGDKHIAYQIWPGGPLDVLFMSDWVIPIDAMAEAPPVDRFLRRLNSFSRLLLWDRRGVGQSDPTSLDDPPTLEQWIDDALAVMDAAGSERAVLLGGDIGGQVAALFAASHPDRTAALVLINSCARFRYDDDHPWGRSDEEVALLLRLVDEHWGHGYPPTEVLAPSMIDDHVFQTWSNRAQRRGASPATAHAILEMSSNCDVRHVLPSIQVPTLVLHSQGDRLMTVENGRYLGANIPGARYVELPGADHPAWLADSAVVLDEIEEFLTGMRRPAASDRVLATVLFTDIVGSTELAARRGDNRWRVLLDQHDGAVRAEIDRFRGREIKTTGDGFLVTFDAPGRAILCAAALRRAAARLGLVIRAGLHCGEIEVREGDVAGLAVHIAARVAALASPGEVLVSRTLVDLVAGSGMGFDDRGEYELKGVPGTWRLFSAQL